MDIKQEGNDIYVAEKKEESCELCGEAENGEDMTKLGAIAPEEIEEQTDVDEYEEQGDTMSEETAEQGGEDSAERYSEYVRELEEKNRALAYEIETLKKKEFSRDDIMAELSVQAHGLREIYPDFELGNEIESPLFLCLAEHMLQSGGLTLQRIYELSHFDEVLESRAAQAADEREEKIVSELKARWQRPGENGLQRSYAESSRRVSDMTRKERAAIAARAAGGAYIKL